METHREAVAPFSIVDRSSVLNFKPTHRVAYAEGKHQIEGLPYSFNNNDLALKARKTESNPDQMRSGALRNASEAHPNLSQTGPVTLGADQRRKYLTALRFHQIDSRRTNTKVSHAETSEWLLAKPEYHDWLNLFKVKDHKGIFWMKGKPAGGKSTVMTFAHPNAKSTVKDTIIISFYFNARGEDLEKTTGGMYRSLLFQLLSGVEES